MADTQSLSKLTLMQKLIKIQEELEAPKSQFNSHGGFSYRSCEDILGAVKPLCSKYGTVLTLSDAIQLTGDRFYVVATATLFDLDSQQSHEVTAFAREAADRKGMDDSQITGATSSYARKYALNGLFAIDDVKDADSDEHQKQSPRGTTSTQSRPQRSGETAPTTQPPKTRSWTAPDGEVVELVDCEVPGCTRGVTLANYEANRRYHEGHTICKLHHDNGDWKSQLKPTTSTSPAPAGVDQDMWDAAEEASHAENPYS